MKFSRVTAAIVMASLSSPLFAGAEQSIGKLTSASQGTFIARDGKLIPAVAGQALVSGDRVVTRDRASARVAFQGCSVNLASTSMMAVNASSCATKPVSFAAQEPTTDTTGSGDTTTDGLTGGEIAVGVGAGVAIILGVVAATDNGDSRPSSP